MQDLPKFNGFNPQKAIDEAPELLNIVADMLATDSQRDMHGGSTQDDIDLILAVIDGISNSKRTNIVEQKFPLLSIEQYHCRNFSC